MRPPLRLTLLLAALWFAAVPHTPARAQDYLQCNTPRLSPPDFDRIVGEQVGAAVGSHKVAGGNPCVMLTRANRALINVGRIINDRQLSDPGMESGADTYCIDDYEMAKMIRIRASLQDDAVRVAARCNVAMEGAVHGIIQPKKKKKR